MAWKPKVKRHTITLVKKTIAGNTNYVKRRPTVITSIVSGTTITGRTKHGGETHASVTQFRGHAASGARNGNYYMG